MIAYLHGFNSDVDPDNEKVKILRENFDDVLTIGYDSFAPRERILQHIHKTVEDCIDDIVFVGTSLGGYFSIEAGRVFDRPSIAVNCAMDPYSFFSALPDKEYVNYVNKTVERLKHSSIESYRGREVSYRISDYTRSPLMIFDAEDEVFSTTESVRKYSDFQTVVFPGGNHRFSHMPEAIKFMKNYLKMTKN